MKKTLRQILAYIFHVSPGKNPEGNFSAKNENIEDKIIEIQRSTHTTFKQLCPLHNDLRLKYPWYYKWHLKKYSSKVHFLALIFYCLLSVWSLTIALFSFAAALVLWIIGAVSSLLIRDIKNLRENKKNVLAVESKQEIDNQIMEIHRSTKTLFKNFSIIHNFLRAKFVWYYRWTLYKYSNDIHWAALLIAFILPLVFVFNLYRTPIEIKASMKQELVENITDSHGRKVDKILKPTFVIDSAGLIKSKDFKKERGTYAIGDKKIETGIYKGTQRLDNIKTEISSGPNEPTNFKVSVPEQEGFKPGRYVLKVSLSTPKTTQILEQNFLWGVLGMNFDKSTYEVNETANVGMAVLDDTGYTLCDASVLLTISDPSGQSQLFSTEAGNIFVSSTCENGNVTNNPDYYTSYIPKSEGSYKAELVANTKNGQRTMSVNFEVKQGADFVISRPDTSMRIYVMADYKVNISVLAKNDFSGIIKENVPNVLRVYNISDGGQLDYSGKNGQQINWNVIAQAGETVNLSYNYDPPTISPEFYLLGPLEIWQSVVNIDSETTIDTKSSYIEPRSWQITGDATQTYLTGSGSWTSLVTGNVSIECWGGGGAGGGQSLATDGGGGGGGGAYSKVNALAVTKDLNYSYAVGAGGTGVASSKGNDGGNSTFNSTSCVAFGGTGGSPSTGTPPAGGAGGASASGTGDVKYSGGQGEKGADNPIGQGGYGGSSAGTASVGYSGPSTFSTITYPTGSTPAGAGYGGDGGGANVNGSAPALGYGGGGGGSGEGLAKTGGNGANGKIVITFPDDTAPTVALNTVDSNAFGLDTTPTLDFTGTDANYLQDIRYNIQIDTTSSFNSGGLIDKVSGTDAGFAGTPDSTDPFTSGQAVNFTVQTPIADGQYYWRVRGLDPLGTNTYGSWSSARNFSVGPVNNISGSLYDAVGGAKITASKTIKISVNGGTAVSGTTTSGDFSINVTMAANDIITVYVSGDAIKASTVTKVISSAALTNFNLFQSFTTIRHEGSITTIASTDLATADNLADTDILFAVDASSNATFREGLYILTAKTYTPGANVTVFGSYTNAGTFVPGTGTVTLSSFATGKTITSNGQALNKLNVNNGLVGYWKIDEGTGTTVNDYSGNALNGTASASATWGTGVNSTYYGGDPGSITLNGSSGYISVPHNVAIKPDTQLTLEAWVKPATGTLNALREIYRKEDGTSRHLFGFQPKANCSGGGGTGGCVSIGLSIGGSYSELDVNIAATDWENAWHLVTMTYDGQNRRIYRDGVQIGIKAETGAIGTTGTAAGYIGSMSGSGEFFSGSIDDFRIYNRALSTSEISALYAGTSPTEGTYTLQDDLSLNGDLTIRTGGIDVSSNNRALNLAGNFYNISNFTARAGTVNMVATATGKTITSSGQTFYNLAFNHASGGWQFEDAPLIGGNLTVTNSETAGNGVNLNNKTVTISGNLSVGGGKLTAGSSIINLAGNFAHTAGTFAEGTSTVNLTGGNGSTQAISGSSTFYKLIVSTQTNGAGRTIQFAGSSTTTISNTWTVTGYSGKVVTMQSSDANNWTINATNPTVTYALVNNSANTGPAFCATYSSGSNNTGWALAAGSSCGASMSGSIYTNEDKSTNIGASKTIAISINGATKSTVESGVGGTFTFLNVNSTNGDSITIFVDDESGVEANLVTRVIDNSASLADIELYTNKIVLRSENSTAITNSFLATANDCADSNIHFTDSSGVVSFDPVYEVWIRSGATYTPGGDVSMGDLDINGTFSAGSNSITVSGSWDNLTGVFTAGTSTNIFNSTASDEVMVGTLNGSSSFYNLTFNGSGGVWTLGGPMSVLNNLAIDNGLLNDNGNQITGNSTGTMTAGAGGTLKLSSGAAQTSTLVQTKSAYVASSIAPNTAPTAGNLLIAVVEYGDFYLNMNPTVSDTNGNTWSTVTKFTGTGQYYPSIAVAYAYNCKGGATTINWTGLTNNDAGVQVFEVSGILASSDPYDMRANVDGYLLAATTTPTISNFTTNYQDFILAIYSNEAEASADITQGSNYTLAGFQKTHADAQEYRTSVSSGTQSATFNATASVNKWIISAIGFREASALGTNFPTGFTSDHITLDPASTIIYNSSTSQSISNITDYGNLRVSTGSGAATKTLAGAVNVYGDLIIDANNTLDVGSLANYAINLYGDFANSGDFLPRMGTVTLSGSGTVSTNAKSFYNLTNANSIGAYSLLSDLTSTNTFTISSGSFTSGAYSILVKDFVLSGGVFTAPTSADSLTVSGNFAHTAGTFTAPASSTVILGGADGSTQVVSGSTTFANLTATATAARVINFASGTTQTVTGTWTVTGASGQNITLGRDGGTGTNQWSINPTAWSVNYVTVSNSNNQASSAINPTIWTDVTNNTNWKFLFLSKWNTTNTSTGSSNSNQITLPLISTGTYNFVVNWGDGSSNTITAYNQAEITHTYAVSGVKDLEMNGVLNGWSFNNLGDRLKITQISQWSNFQPGNLGRCFYGAANLKITATDVLNLTGVTTLVYAFRASGIDTVPSMNSWNLSNITNVAGMFQDASLFNQDISSWDVSKAANMSVMFQNAALFNQDISGWNTVGATNMSSMFLGASDFNQNIGGWNVSGVTNMGQMFAYATDFNQNIGGWNVGIVSDMSRMFRYATNFNQNIGSWNVANVTDMSYMFHEADAFNQNIGSWNVVKVTTMYQMFMASSFNQDISNWNVSNVTNMQYMLSGLTLSTSNYSNILIDWSALTLKTGVIFTAGSSKYYSGAAATARAAIISSYTWAIADGGEEAGAVVPVNNSLTLVNPYGGTGNIIIADDTTVWDYRALVTHDAGPNSINYVMLRLANNADSSSPYDSLRIKWDRALNAFTEDSDTQSALTLGTSTSSVSGNQWTLDFKFKINNSFLNKDTQYAAELYSVDGSLGSDQDNYTNFYQVKALSLSLSIDSLALSFGNLIPGDIFTGASQITANTNYPEGYTLSVSDGVAGSGSALLLSGSSTRVQDYSGTISAPTVWSSGTGLGICVFGGSGKDTNKWGTGTVFDSILNKYAGVPETAASAEIYTKTGSVIVNDVVDIGYKLIVPNTQTTGNYEGSITYSVTGVLQ